MSDLRQFFAAFRAYFLNAALFSFFINLLLLVPSLYMLQVFDRVLSSRSVDTLLMLTLASVGVLLLFWLLDYLRGLLLQSAGAKLDRMLGERVIASLIEHARRPQRAEYLHGLRDVAVLRNFLAGNSIVALFDAPWMIFFVLVIFLFHPLLGVVAAAGMLTLFVLAWINEKTNREPLEKIQVDSRRAAQFIDQGLNNADVLNAMGMRDGFVSRWNVLNNPVLSGTVSTGRIMGLINSTSKFMRQLIQVAMMGTGAYLVIDADVTPGVMIASTIILGRALAPVENLIGNWNNLVQARAAFGRLRGFFAPDKLTPQRTQLPIPEGWLSVEGVRLAGRSPDQPIIRHVAFELGVGESLAVVGPSASGKSSLAKLLVGVWTPSFGCIRLDGADVSKLDHRDLGPYLGYLPQDVELFPGTISENIARFGKIDSGAVVAAAKRAYVHELILRLPQGYDTRISDEGYILSGGQMQRVALARALYGNPCLVVLDEPNANLDAEGEMNLLRVLADLKSQRVTVVMVTHKPSLLGGLDKVLVMKEGQMDAIGPCQQVLSRITSGMQESKSHASQVGAV